MAVTRIDLDGRGAGSPEGLVALILKHEPEISVPVPIEALCRQLDIEDIRPLETDGFEGGLLTTSERRSGIILVNEASHPYRRRFTIGHELGHFLIPTHMPSVDGRFLCSRADLSLLTASENDRRARWEVEANRFSSLLLMPPPFLRREFAKSPEPDLRHLVAMARRFQVSKEAMARSYANHHPEAVAVLVTHDGTVLRRYYNRIHFPYIQSIRRAQIPAGSTYHRTGREEGFTSDPSECSPALWINIERGKRSPTMMEQVHRQKDGFCLIMLHLIVPDADEEDEDRELEDRWTPRFRN